LLELYLKFHTLHICVNLTGRATKGREKEREVGRSAMLLVLDLKFHDLQICIKYTICVTESERWRGGVAERKRGRRMGRETRRELVKYW
jgi:hypothetical protein